MPTTLPALSSSGPPESPGRIGAFVSITPVSRWRSPLSLSTVIDLLSRMTLPRTEMRRPIPPEFPTAVTLAPTVSVAEFPIVTVLRLVALRS